MGLWFWRLEERVGQFSHPHRNGRGDAAFWVHHGVEKRFQISLRVPSDMDDLVSGRRVVLAGIHCSKSERKLSSVQNFHPKISLKISLSSSQTSPTNGKREKNRRVLVINVPSHPKVEHSTTLSPFSVLTIETSSQRQRFLTVSCLHICDSKQTDICIPLPNVMFVALAPTFPNGKKWGGEKSDAVQTKKTQLKTRTR